MVRIHPIADSEASSETERVFTEIKERLQIDAVPLIFRYVANAEPFLSYLWASLGSNLASAVFLENREKLCSFVSSSMRLIYTPSLKAASFVATLDDKKKQQLIRVTEDLLRINGTLFFFALDLREDLKTAFTTSDDKRQVEGERDLFLGRDFVSRQATSEDDAALRMLAPIFGSDISFIPSVAAFFRVVEEEMGRLSKKEAYLKTRVELERVGILYLPKLPYRVLSNYKVFMNLIHDKHIAYDLLYLLKNVFPAEFPRLLLTAALMQRLLDDKRSIATL